MTAPPKDKYNAVWLIFFTLGLGTLLPWNFFMTATMYFTSRLGEPASARIASDIGDDFTTGFPNVSLLSDPNMTEARALEPPRSQLQSKFNNVMTLCAMLPLLIFTCLNSILHSRIPQKIRIAGSLAAIFLVFLMTAIFVKIEFSPITFFTVTMIKIIFINSFGALLQGSLFGLAALFPASYTAPIMSGQGLAGTFAALAMICALASGSALEDSAFGYFITACVVVLLALLSYLALPKLEFYRYYTSENLNKTASNDMELKKDLLKGDNATEAGGNKAEHGKPSIINILKKIWVLALSVCLVFAVTIGIFPSVTADVKSTIAGDSTWGEYCYMTGRPGKDSILLPIMVAARLIFLPLFMLCNVMPRQYLPVLLSHDAWYICIMIVFAVSNGYLASLCMCFGPKNVDVHEAETAGAIMAFFLSLGLALGAAFSFLLRILV
ncbi:PREDICTED: equilibrative nucleoside transporter 1 [Nanorana parkeri]|uniref:equilibrative nucleoside transporter 1 n=1 Tax=Nanorana parkeri TaxID=125878 RepID=UPI0008548876|nr:PREDICTED: equilibrative nucleoside transporter 1 [Nanorana parkeri]